MIDNRVLGELKFEIDSCYVSAELALGQKYPESLVNALLLEACFLHFRVVWDFFYGTRQAETDVLLRDFLPGKIPKALRPKKPPRLQEIRTSLDETLAHLTTKRIGPGFKAGRITFTDLQLMQQHIEELFTALTKCVSVEQRTFLVNPLAGKFSEYNTLKA